MEFEHRIEDEVGEIVALAALLLELAHIDGEFSAAEAELVVSLLGPALARGLVKEQDLFVRARALLRRVGSIDDIARALRARLSAADRLAVVELLWRVARADGRVDRYEANLTNRLAKLLDVSARFGASRS